jgi:hypothetical protein
MNANKLKVFLIVFAIAGLFCAKTYAAGVMVRIEEPATPVTDSFDLVFVALDTEGRSIVVQCEKKLHTEDDSAFSQFGSDITLSSGGNTSSCQVTEAILGGSGEYDFRVSAQAEGGAKVYSDKVTVEFNGESPSKPQYIEKDKKDSFTYKITFKTANDGQTSYAEVYRSDELKFKINDSTKINTITVGPNEKYSFDDTRPECSRTYYYAVRAFNSAGIPSSVRAEKVLEVSETEGEVTVETEEETQGAIAVGGSTVAIEGGETVEGATTEPSGSLTTEEGVVLGKEDKTTGGESTLGQKILNNWFLLGIPAALIVIYSVLRRSKKKTF